MAKGNMIVVNVEAKGNFIEGVAQGSILGGIVVQIDADGAVVGNRRTWEPFNGAADGERTAIALSYNLGLTGDVASAATADGYVFGIYFPLPGDELNVLVQADAGAVSPGDKLIVDDGTGKLIKTTGTPESEPFIVLETSADSSSDRLVHVMYTGH